MKIKEYNFSLPKITDINYSNHITSKLSLIYKIKKARL